jgi:hypothetical protein
MSISPFHPENPRGVARQLTGIARQFFHFALEVEDGRLPI